MKRIAMIIILSVLASVMLSGCASLNPNGTVEATYDPSTGLISYKSTKNVSIYMKKTPKGTEIKIQTDATAGVEARSKETSNIIKLIKLVK